MGIVEALSALDYSQLKIMFCKRFDQDSSIWNLEQHSHAYLELLFFLRGEAEISAGEQTLSSQSYDLVLYLPHREHREIIDLSKAQEIVCVWVDVGEFPQIGEGAYRFRDRNRTLEWLFVQLEREHGRNALYSTQLARCYLEAIFHQILRQLARSDSESVADVVAKTLDYIKEHFTQHISVSHLAELCHVSPSYLHRIFHKQLGVSPGQYVTNLRVKEAEYLLGSSTLPIAQVAEHCGYEDPRYFSRVFKRETGLSPGEYRANCLKT